MQSPLSGAQIDQKWSDLAENDDLNWDLGAISNRQEAIAFLLTFENKLCVYSAYVSKLYSTYNIVVPKNSDSGCITVLPDPHASVSLYTSDAADEEDSGAFGGRRSTTNKKPTMRIDVDRHETQHNQNITTQVKFNKKRKHDRG